jgi:hypothetical protein
VVLLAVTVAAVALLLPGLGALVSDVGAALTPGAETPVAQALARAADLLGRAEAVSGAVRLLARSVIAPVMAVSVLLVALMCLACAAFGAAITRLACGKVQL